METILLTWWAWYIGSHTAVNFLEKWYNVIVLDNLFNSEKSVIEKIEKITWKKVKFYEVDLRNKEDLRKIFLENKIDFVIHFAWLKAVWESCEKPFFYYENNILWSLNLFEIMDEFSVKNIIFSSSATVYDNIKWKAPFFEYSAVWNTTSPYWTTKLILENILRDLSNHKNFKVINLRYFNPIWAHRSGFLWENPNWIPNNLLPYLMKVVSRQLEFLQVFWDDYETKDWSWERDYIHILDLAESHFQAFLFLKKKLDKVYEEINIWTGKTTSVFEIIKITEKICWQKINYKIFERRSWDVAVLSCNPEKAKKILSWQAVYSVEDAVKDSLNFIEKQKNKL